jgi:hypothetical protein
LKGSAGDNLSPGYFLGRNDTRFGAKVNADHESLVIDMRKTDTLLSICNDTAIRNTGRGVLLTIKWVSK